MKSRSPVLSIGDQPAATLPAIIPAITVGAPNAEFDRDLIDLDRFRESGVGAGEGELKLSSRVGVCGTLIELDRE